MKGLATLIKLSKQALDELRRTMVSLENQKVQLLQLIDTMKAELTQEMTLAGRTPEMSRFFGDFSKRIKQREEEIRAEVNSLDGQMDKLRDDIATAFSELKKYEIAQEHIKKREREEQNRKETILLDDIASQQYLRQQKEESD